MVGIPYEQIRIAVEIADLDPNNEVGGFFFRVPVALGRIDAPEDGSSGGCGAPSRPSALIFGETSPVRFYQAPSAALVERVLTAPPSARAARTANSGSYGSGASPGLSGLPDPSGLSSLGSAAAGVGGPGAVPLGAGAGLHSRPAEFSIAAEWMADRIIGDGLDPVACFHSHPSGVADPSATDLQFFPIHYCRVGFIYAVRAEARLRIAETEASRWSVVEPLGGPLSVSSYNEGGKIATIRIGALEMGEVVDIYE